MPITLGAAEQVFRAPLPGEHVNEVKAELVPTERLRLPKAREIHRIASQPVLHIGPVGHSARPVFAHDLKRIAASFQLRDDQEAYGMPQFHPSLAKRAG